MSELWQTAGHILLKKSAQNLHPEAAMDRKWFSLLLFNLSTWGGLLLILIGLTFWYFALSRDDLSVVYTLGSLQYVIALIGSYFFLNERINKNKIFGTILVIAGITLMTLSSHKV